MIAGAVAVTEERAEYPMLHARFAELVHERRCDADLAPPPAYGR
jgi:hypothetical protein